MSDAQKQNLEKAPATNGNTPRQAEAVAQKAEIVHPDGTREEIVFKGERYWSGALPRPEDFAGYADVVPDAPERILRMAEKEQDHRIETETRIIRSNDGAGKRGQWLGAGLSAMAMGLAVYAHLNGAPWQLTAALVGVPVMSVARSLVSALRSDD